MPWPARSYSPTEFLPRDRIREGSNSISGAKLPFPSKSLPGHGRPEPSRRVSPQRPKGTRMDSALSIVILGDLTEALEQAPHGPDLLDKFPIIGQLIK